MSIITVSIQLDHKLARSLGGSSTANFIAQQPDRFAVMAVNEVDDPAHDDIAPLLSADFEGGVMTWLATLTEALLLRAFEQGRATGRRCSATSAWRPCLSTGRVAATTTRTSSSPAVPSKAAGSVAAAADQTSAHAGCP